MNAIYNISIYRDLNQGGDNSHRQIALQTRQNAFITITTNKRDPVLEYDIRMKYYKLKLENKAVIIAALLFFLSILLSPAIEEQPKAEDKVGKLIPKLQDKQARVRADAVKELGKIMDSRAVPFLINALKDTDSYVRGQAARALGKIKDTRAVKPLINLLDDDFIYVREEAATALGDIKDALAVDPLINFLKKDYTYAREEAAKSLMKIGLPAIAPLINAPKENNLKLVADAYYFFVCRGESGSEAVLIQALYKYGTQKMDVDFANCGNIQLKEAAQKWAESHNIKIKVPLGAGNGPVWGRCKS
jgi:HEAT repeat protein